VDDERVVCLGLDISGSITIADFYAGKPERAKRWISMGIAEQSATAAAAGLAREGKLPVLGSYATFSAARNLDQLRVSVCYSNFNVFVAGAHAGVSVGPDGATHQALEDLFAMLGLPNMSVVVPCDAIETRKATRLSCFSNMLGRNTSASRARPRPSSPANPRPSSSGKANVIRLRAEKAPTLSTAFETQPRRGLRRRARRSEHRRHAARWCPRQCARHGSSSSTYGYETRILNMHTLKPIDAEAAIIRAARETGVWSPRKSIRLALSPGASVLFSRPAANSTASPSSPAAIGVKDRFGDSGAPWELVKELEVSAEHIAQKAIELVAVKKAARDEEATGARFVTA
jgi:transketolase